MPPASGPSASNQAGQPEGQLSGTFGTSASHPGEGTWVEGQVSERRGKANWLLPFLPFGMIYAGLGGGKAAEKVSTFFWCVTCQQVTGLLLGMDVSLADLPLWGFCLEPPTVA